MFREARYHHYPPIQARSLSIGYSSTCIVLSRIRDIDTPTSMLLNIPLGEMCVLFDFLMI